MITGDAIPAYNVPSGILFDMHREAAAKRPGVLTKVGMDTFADPDRQGCAMNAKAAGRADRPRVEVRRRGLAVLSRRSSPTSRSSAPRRRTSAATSPTSMRAASSGRSIRRWPCATTAASSSRRSSGSPRPARSSPHEWWCRAYSSTTSWSRPTRCRRRRRVYEPAISGEMFRPLSSFETPKFDIGKVIARRVAQEMRDGDAVNIGFGISANVPRILIEEGRHGDVTWVIEQGAVGGVPLLDFQFGCSSNAEAIVPSPHQFTYFQGGGFDVSLLSFLQIDRGGSVNVSQLGGAPHVTAGAGGFVDITARAKQIVFSGFFTAAAKLAVVTARSSIRRRARSRSSSSVEQSPSPAAARSRRARTSPT